MGAGGLAALAPAPLWLRLAGLGVALVAAWFTAASLGAFHWMFDRSDLLTGRWLPGPPPARWVQLSVALEQTTLPLESVFPDAEGRSFDLFDPEVTSEPAVGRARAARGSALLRVAPDDVPVEDAWAELVVVPLAAHEVRDPAVRRAFFAELERILAPGGRLVLAEHPRNLASLLAFGPGVLHFLPRSEWVRRAADAGLEVVERRAKTPFVDLWTLQKGGG